MQKHGTRLADVAIPDGLRRWLRDRMSVTTAEELAFLVTHYATRLEPVLKKFGTEATAVECALRDILSAEIFQNSITPVDVDEFVFGTESPEGEEKG